MAYYPGTPYEPLPLTTDSTSPPPGPSHSQFDLAYHSQSPSTHDLTAEDPNPAYDIPSGATQPRFMGTLYSDQPGLRHSYSSFQSSIPMASSVYNSSVYALDPNSGAMQYMDDPRSSYQPEAYGMSPLSPADRTRFLEEKNVVYISPRENSKRRIRFWIIIAGVGILLLVAAIVVYFLVIKPKSQTSSDSGSTVATSTSTAAKPATTSKAKVAITGGDGSTVTTEDGSTFVYRNSFGGYWYYDENDPFNNAARAQSWSPALNETFQYGTDQIRG